MNKYDILFISPHLDDIVYSCSQMIREKVKNNKILVITIFTHYPDNNSNNPFLNGDGRIKEDKKAMESLGVDYMHLHYSELMIRNNMINYNIFQQIIEPIKTLLYLGIDNHLTYNINYDIQKIINDYNIEETYYPGAVGFHPDHILTYRSCYNLKNTRLICYEEFPYSTHWIYKFIRVPFIKSNNVIKIKIKVEDKIEDIMKYKSQFKIIFGNEDILNILKNYYETYYFHI